MEQGAVQNKPMLSEQRVLYARCKHPQGDHANGKCVGLGFDKNGNPNCVCEGFSLDIGRSS
jgi:hypothetical protein